MKIPLFRPSLGKEEIKALEKLFKTGWIGLGPKTAEFEEKFALYTRAKYAIGLNSCTAALHLAIQVFNFKEGDEVLVPSITFISTAHAVVYNKLKPIFVDVKPGTLCIDIKDAEAKITPKTKAIIPVHIGGQPCQMDEIIALAKTHNLIVIEDVANAAGGEYKGKKLGSLGDMGCFSFEAKKNMTTGDGGMIVTNYKNKVEVLRRIRWLGIDKDTWKRFSSGKESGNYSWYYEVHELGYKYNMNDIQAAIGLIQLQKLDAMNAAKREIIKKYLSNLHGLKSIELPEELDLQRGAYWLFVIKCTHRDKLISYLASKGITTGVHFMPVHLHPYYNKNFKTLHPLKEAETVWQKILSLPLYPSMKDEEINYVCENIKAFDSKL